MAEGTTNLHLPDTLNGLPVTEIADGAFAGCAQLESVHLPAQVTRIPPSAFNETPKLREITVSESNPCYRVVDGACAIGENAFAGARQLTGIILPDTVVSLGDCAFSGTGLTEIEIPASVTDIGHDPFSGCDHMVIVTSEGSFAQQYAGDDGILCIVR